MAALALVWCTVAASGPVPSRLPEAAARAVDNVSPDELRSYVGTLVLKAHVLLNSRFSC